MLNRISTLAYVGLLSVLFLSSVELQARNCYPPRRAKPACAANTRCWLDSEYLYWNYKDSPEPVPLVVKGHIPSSNVVLGGKGIKNDWRSGGKLALGYWFDDTQRLGGEVSYLYFPTVSKKQTVSSDGSPGSATLSAPFFNVLTDQENFNSIARPGVFSGTATLKLKNSMQSAELNVVAPIAYDCSWSFGLLAGLRYWNFTETLELNTDSPFIPPFPADVYRTTDKFHAENHFYGGQCAVKVNYACNQFFLSIQGKAAFGTMHQRGEITGKLLTNDFNGFGAVETFPGGYFTVPSNIRNRKTECFAIIPEVNVNACYQMTDRIQFRIGYTFLYVNNVLWAGNEINAKINPTQSTAMSGTPNPVLVGEARPKVSLDSAKFWAQGLNAGFEFAF